MSSQAAPTETVFCPACRTQWGPHVLACPGCSRLVHSERLKSLSAAAADAEQQDQTAQALQCWREVLSLLPIHSKQYAVVAARIARLESTTSTEASSSDSASAGSTWSAASGRSRWAAGGMIGAVAVFFATKFKLLLLGLTKLSTVLTMLASAGVYWTEFGWKFAVGLVVSLYVHEMGHVAALRHYGLDASAPMFIPGLGAFVRLRQNPSNPRQNARIGLAGPIWGTAAALVAYGVGLACHWPAWVAIGHIAAFINLFNLLPVWQLDGSRGFAALDRASRLLLVGVMAGAWYYTSEGLLTLIMIVAGFRALTEPGPQERDSLAWAQYAGLIVILSAMCAHGLRGQ